MSRDLEKMLDTEVLDKGLTWDANQRGKHIAIRITGRCGQGRNVIISTTPGDHRALLNTRGDVRRAVRSLCNG